MASDSNKSTSAARVFSDSALLKYLEWPKISLAIAAESVASSAPELPNDSYLSITFARSQHDQIALYPLVIHHRKDHRLMTAPFSGESSSLSESIIAASSQVIAGLPWRGSGLMRFDEQGGLVDVVRGVQRESVWTLELSNTSAFENELRAVHDLPLGNVEMRNQSWLMMEFHAAQELDMFRPYLHLCARNPRYRFHHFDTHTGVVILSDELAVLAEEVEHAVAYLEGVIDE